MKRTEKNIGGYRGRRSLRDILKWVVRVLVILLLLVVLALIVGQRYVVYTDDGIRLELPFLPEPEKRPAPPAGSEDIVLEEEPKKPEEPPREEPVIERRSALELPLEALLDGSAAGKLEAAGAEVLIVTMKARDGSLNWVSGERLAGDGKVNSSRKDINEKLREWNAGDQPSRKMDHPSRKQAQHMHAGRNLERVDRRDVPGKLDILRPESAPGKIRDLPRVDLQYGTEHEIHRKRILAESQKAQRARTSIRGSLPFHSHHPVNNRDRRRKLRPDRTQKSTEHLRFRIAFMQGRLRIPRHRAIEILYGSRQGCQGMAFYFG